MSFLQRMLLSFIAGSLLTSGVGCQSSYKYTLNPDGSGKVVYSVTLIKDKRDNSRRHPEEVITQSEGVEAWEDVKIVTDQDGGEVFTATAYFKDLAALKIKQADRIRPTLVDNGDGTKTLRCNVWQEGPAKIPAGDPLTDEQIEAAIAKTRKKFASSKSNPMFRDIRKMRHTFVFQPLGRIQSVSNMKRRDDGTLEVVFDVGKVLDAFEAVAADDQLMQEAARRGEIPDHPGEFLTGLVNEKVFGTRGPIEAVLAGPFQPAFNYQKAVAAAEADPIRALLSSGLIPSEMPKAGAKGNISDITNLTAQVKDGRLRLSFTGRLPKAGTKAQGAELYRVVDNQDRMLVPAIGVSRRGGGFLNDDGQTMRLSFHMRNAPQNVNSIQYAAGVFYYDIIGSESLHSAGELELKVGAQNAAKNFRILGLDQNEDGFFLRWQADAPPMLYSITFKVGDQTVKRFDTVPVPEASQVENTWISLGGKMPEKVEVVFHVTDKYEQVEAPFVLQNVPVEVEVPKQPATALTGTAEGKLPDRSLEDITPTVWPAACQYSNDGKLFATAPHDVLVFEAVTRKLVKRFRVTGMPIVTIDFSDDATLMAIGVKNYDEPADESVGMEIVVVGLADGKEIARFPGLRAQNNIRRRLAISPGNKAIANSNADGITVFDIASGKPIWEWTIDRETNPNSSYSDFHMTPDWKFFLFNLQRISYPTKETSTPARFENEDRSFFWINRISPDGTKALAVGGPNGTNQRVFDLATGQLLRETEGMVTFGVAVSPDFGMVVNERGYWYTETGKAVKIKPYVNDGIGIMAFHPGGQEVTVGARYYRPANFQEDQTKFVELPQWGRESTSFYFALRGSFTADDQFVLAAGRDLRTIDLTARRIGPKEYGERDDNTHKDRYGFAAQAYSPDKKVRIDRDGNIFDPDTSREPTGAIFTDAKNRSPGTPFFASERVVAFVTSDKLYVYGVREKKIYRSYDFQPRSELVQMSSCGKGRMLGIVEGHFRIGHRRYLRVIDLATGKEAVPVQLKPQCRIALSPGGRRLLVYGHMWCEVYDTASGERVTAHRIGNGTIRGLVFSPSGDQMAIMLSDRVTIVALPSCTPIATVVTGGASPLDNMGLFDAGGKLVAFEGDHRAIFAE